MKMELKPQINTKMKKILHVDMDAFYVEVELLSNPELRGQPVIVGAKSPRGVVSTCSYEARKFGIHSGMPSIQAQRLCPRAIWLDGDFHAYSLYSRKFVEILRRFSPDVVQLSIDEARIDLTGSELLFGPAQNIAHRILTAIHKELGLPASGGLANSGTSAKIASELAKPHGLAIILPGNESAFLAPLKIERIPGIGQKGLPRLHQKGLYRIGDLARTSTEDLYQMLGRWAGVLQNVALGVPGKVQRRNPKSTSRSHEKTFAKNLTDSQTIRIEVRKLVEKLGYRIRRKELKARTITVKIRDGNFNTITRTESLDSPANSDRILFRSAMNLIERNIPRHIGIRLIGVSVQNLVADKRQLDLFTSEDDKLATFYKTVDSIKDKFGKRSVGFGSNVLGYSGQDIKRF